MKKLTSAEMAEHREHVHAEARERISGIGGALRMSLNNLVVGSLREYIALSRHQLEMSEYINIHTGRHDSLTRESEDPDDLWIQKIDWPTGQYHPFRMATRPVEQDKKALPPMWAVEQLRDVMWRVRAVGSVLGRSGNRLVATDADGITELSNHQCEIADFLRTGKFKKVPRRRKARYLGSDGTQSAETAQRVRELGEALKEYQGRIEIKTVREFIALSKHQCELAGMVIASEREMKSSPVFQVVGYEEAYGIKDNHASGVAGGNVDSRFHGNDGNPAKAGQATSGVATPLAWQAGGGEGICLSGPVGKRPRERGKHEDERFVMSEPEGRVESRPSEARTRGESASPGVPFCDTFGHAKVSKEKLACNLNEDSEKNNTLPLSLHGIIRHPTGKPAENIRVQVDLSHGAEGQSIICLDEITDREGRFAFETGGPIRPPDNIIIRGELLNRVMNQPLPEADVHITIGGNDGRAFSAVTDYRGRFAAGEGAPQHRPRREPLWTQVENDDGPQFYEWDMGWDKGYP